LRIWCTGVRRRGVRRSLIEVAEKALETDEPGCRELAERLLREVGQIPFDRTRLAA
jgi:hypothetical protein